MDGAIEPRPRDLTELPLTALQTRWWFLCTSYPGGMSPLVGLVHRLHGPLDVPKWCHAVSTVVDRHEILRTLFKADGPVQVVGPANGIHTEYLEVRDDDNARELLNESRKVALDLEKGPLVRSTLLRIGEEDYVWSMTIHHILADGYSLGVIDRELGQLYSGSILPPLPLQYGDFALQDREPDDEDRTYWREQLRDVPPLELKDALPRPAEKGAPAAEIGLVIEGLTQGLDALARSARCTRFMVLLAALQVLLSRASGQTDFCIGIPIAGVGRTRPELAALVGLFNNALALRCDLSGDPRFIDILGGTRETVLDALDHQDLPWGQVVAEVKAPHDPARAQVFQAMLLHDDVEVASRLDLPGLIVEEFPLATPRVLHDIMVYTRPHPSGLATRFLYDTGLFTAETMIGLAQDYEKLLRAVVQDPTARLSDLR